MPRYARHRCWVGYQYFGVWVKHKKVASQICYMTHFVALRPHFFATPNVSNTIKWAEEVLLASSLFSLPIKRELVQSSTDMEIVGVYTTETPIQRPKCQKKQKDYYSSKKTAYRKVSTNNKPQNRNHHFHRAL